MARDPLGIGHSGRVSEVGLRQVLAVALVLAWLGLAGAGLAWAVLISTFEDKYCEVTEYDSNYGELRWSMIPPGPQCVWTVEENGFDETKGPSPVMSVWLGALVALGVATRQSIRSAGMRDVLSYKAIVRRLSTAGQRTSEKRT